MKHLVTGAAGFVGSAIVAALTEQEGAEVVGVDVVTDYYDVAQKRANLARVRLEAEVVEADVMAWDAPGRYGAILLDAPCTATGIFARHPDVLHRIGAKDIAALAGLQARMLARAAGWLAPGGRLIYASCSLEPEEGEQIVAAFLATNSGFRLDPPTNLPDFVTPDDSGQLRILPGLLEDQGGLDGFFAARLVRVAD